ncbi:MAG: hypothetical protein GXY76_09620 [Chloroflexi bacterium]|nr:hypothetical protein [Chloroflexota bacterium]
MPEQEPQSFILKVWVEETAEEAGRVTWRGHITHVPSNLRRYIQDLGEIERFVAPYLERLGVQLERPAWWRRLLRRRQTRSDPTSQCP